jgi:L-cysteine/cystine lyase
MPDQFAARWAERRAHTPVTRQYAYLNCGFVGPISDSVADAMRKRMELEIAHGATTRHVMENSRGLNEQLRAAGARLFGCDVDEVAITGNTTEGVNIAVNGLELSEGDGVVTTSLEHAGGLIPAYWACHRRGADLHMVSITEDGPGAVVEAFDRAIDARTKLVLLSEITYSNGQLLPVQAITELAHARGATVVIDGAQTAGHIPLKMRELGVDAYAVPSHKWLCGPAGLGLLYVKRERIPDLEPSKVGGRAAAAYDYEGAFTPEKNKVTKFEVSTISAIGVAGMVAAIEQYLDADPQAVWDRARELNRYAERVIGAVPGVRLISSQRDDARTGHFVFALEGADPGQLSGWMQAEDHIVCRSVAQLGAVRLSLNVYNTEAELDRVAALLGRVASGEVTNETLAKHAPAPFG